MAEYGLTEEYMSILREEGYVEFTEIQELSLPYIVGGYHTLIIAPTGSGKTEAALIPIMYMASNHRGIRGILALYITPLRALNRDIFRRMKKLADRVGLSLDVRHGDTPIEIRAKQVLEPPHILITTPETLQILLVSRNLRRHLESVRWVVIDEIHEFAYDKRGVQLFLSLQRLKGVAGRDFQRIGLSATVYNPEYIARLLSDGGEVKIIESKARRRYSIQVSYSEAWEDTAKLLSKIIKEHGSTLIFTNTRQQSESLCFKLRLFDPELPVKVHHSSLSRDVRVKVEEELKSGVLKALICTSSLELGVDIGSVDYVVHYGSPRQTVKLIHRIGRSGHRIGSESSGMIVAYNPEDLMESCVIAKRATSATYEPEPELYGALDVAAHQIVGIVLERGRAAISDALETIKGCILYRDLTLDEFVELVNFLERIGLLRVRGSTLIPTSRSYRYYFENLSTIVDVSRFDVLDRGGRRVGVLDEDFVEQYCKPESLFILGGRIWRILGIDRDRHIVNVEEDTYVLEAIPVWEGEIIPVPFEVAQEVGRMKRLIAESMASGRSPLKLLSRYHLDRYAIETIIGCIEEQLNGGFDVPSDRDIVVEWFESEDGYRYVVLHAHIGDRSMEALASILAALISAKIGAVVEYVKDAYKILFYSKSPKLDGTTVADTLIGLKSDGIDAIIDEILPYKSFFLWRIWVVARRFGVVGKDVDYSLSTARRFVEIFMDTPLYREAVREVSRDILDIDGCKRFLEKLEEGYLRVKISSSSGLSPMSKIYREVYPVIDSYGIGSVIDMVKTRIESTKVKLVCMGGADWEAIFRVSDITDPIVCPRCGSRRIAVVKPDDFQALRLARMAIDGKLSKNDVQSYKRYSGIAELVKMYGRKAIAALAGIGVGPTTARRILKNLYLDETDFYRAIAEAERMYMKTRPYWD
ncbi:MAG: DEAD/DEAH box helicase [Candidatus Bathyarchaeota archaeon]|nr:DEAD/DEAH box helicase [Candidatus Bathyarchaeota archaeon]